MTLGSDSLRLTAISGPDEVDETADVRVYDPAMCCPTGVCGPSIDPALIRFGSDLQWLQSQGVAVARFNLGQQPHAFLADDAVRALLDERDEAALPATFVDDKLIAAGVYPSRTELTAALEEAALSRGSAATPRQTPPRP